jgi:hypothetical protein
VQDTADLGTIGVHGGVHGDDGALDRRQVTLQQGAVQPDPDDGGGRVAAQ